MCDQPDTLDDLIANCATYPADMAAEITRLRAQRDQLVAALKEMIDWYGDDKGKWPCVDRALAAVAAVEDRND